MHFKHFFFLQRVYPLLSLSLSSVHYFTCALFFLPLYARPPPTNRVTALRSCTAPSISSLPAQSFSWKLAPTLKFIRTKGWVVRVPMHMCAFELIWRKIFTIQKCKYSGCSLSAAISFSCMFCIAPPSNSLQKIVYSSPFAPLSAAIYVLLASTFLFSRANSCKLCFCLVNSLGIRHLPLLQRMPTSKSCDFSWKRVQTWRRQTK